MIRGSLKPGEFAKGGGFGKQEGIARVDGARFKAIQFADKDGNLSTPMFALQFDEVYLDANMKVADPALEAEHANFPLCWGDKESKEGKFRFFPATVKSADAAEAEEVGVSDIDGDDKMKLVEIDAEGNTFVSTDGAVPFENSEIAIFITQLEKLGFKSDILARSYAPDFVGLVYEFKTTEKSVLLPKLGIKYSPGKERKDKKGNVVLDTSREIVKLHVRPYEKGGKAVAAVAAKGGKANGAAAVTEAVAETGNDAETDAAKAAVTTLAGQKLSKKDFTSKVGLHIIKNKSLGASATKLGSGFSNKLKKFGEDDWTALGMELGFEVEGDSITVSA